MNKYIYIVGTATLALAMSGLPAFALAETNGTAGQGEASAQVRVQALGTGVRASTTAQVGEDQKQGEGRQTQGSTFGVQSDINLKIEDDGDLATSNDDLNHKIRVQMLQLASGEASSSPEQKANLKNMNEVRVAVHALLASKDLIGGMGQQVSEIAKHMNDSVASTTKAEAKIQSRGFFAHLFFGGDTTSADVIAQEAAKNQARIDSLTALLAVSNVSADVQVTLKAQITALQTAQTRLQALAAKEKAAWGLFSWRF